MKRALKIFIIIVVLYFLIGFLFTILRSNAHYNYIVINNDPAINNGNSYWENRCIGGNEGKPGTDWCVNGFGQFKIEKMNRFGWYFFFYLKQPSRIPITILFYPLHFLGIDMINFKGVGELWNYG